MKKAPFRRQKSIFRIFLIFTKNKGALNQNIAPAMDLIPKGAFSLKSMDFQLSLEKKIKYIAILDQFLASIKMTHDFLFLKQFSSFPNLPSLFADFLHFFDVLRYT